MYDDYQDEYSFTYKTIDTNLDKNKNRQSKDRIQNCCIISEIFQFPLIVGYEDYNLKLTQLYPYSIILNLQEAYVYTDLTGEQKIMIDINSINKEEYLELNEMFYILSENELDKYYKLSLMCVNEEEQEIIDKQINNKDYLI